MTLGDAAVLQEAMAHHQAGRTDQAAQLYARLPGNPDAMQFLGVIAHQRGDHAQALALIEQAIALNATNAMYHYHLGLVHGALKQWDAAITCYRQAVSLSPRYAAAHCNLGIALFETEHFAEAVASYDAALALQPEAPEVLNNKGNALKELGQFDGAVACARRALALNPRLLRAYIVLGGALLEQRLPQQAEQCYRQAVAISPDNVEFLSPLAMALLKQERNDEALACFRRALAIAPDHVDANSNLANLLNDLGRLDEAALHYRRALARDPDNVKTLFNESLMLLLAGQMEAGWQKHEYRWATPEFRKGVPRCPEPPWLGQQPVAGKRLLLHAEQGIGDTLQMLRFVPLLQAMGAEIYLEVQAPLKALLARLPQVKGVSKFGEPRPQYDMHCPLMSLPLAFQVRPDHVPGSVPYLAPDPVQVDAVRRLLGPRAGLRVGLCWKGSGNYEKDRQRSIGLAPFGHLFAVGGVQFYSLMPDGRADFLAAAGQAGCDLGHELDAGGPPFEETAALVTELDLVISCDTSIGHLAGALGVPVWLALPHVPDWRWMMERADTPWYPATRLYRQGVAGDWDGLFRRIALDLRQRAASAAPGQG